MKNEQRTTDKLKIISFNLLTYLLRPGISPSCPNKIFPHDLIEHCISYLFGIFQSSISLDNVNVCSSSSTSIWVTMTNGQLILIFSHGLFH